MVQIQLGGSSIKRERSPCSKAPSTVLTKSLDKFQKWSRDTFLISRTKLCKNDENLELYIDLMRFSLKCTYPVSWIKQLSNDIKDYVAPNQISVIVPSLAVELEGGWSFWNAITSGLDMTEVRVLDQRVPGSMKLAPLKWMSWPVVLASLSLAGGSCQLKAGVPFEAMTAKRARSGRGIADGWGFSEGQSHMHAGSTPLRDLLLCSRASSLLSYF